LLVAALLAAGTVLGARPLFAQNAPAAQPAERLSRLGGRAYLQRRTPVPGATVLVHHEEHPTVLYLTSTDDEGEFRVAGLIDGFYRVRVEREGLGAQVKEGVSVKFPFRAVVELDLDPVPSQAAAKARIIPVATSTAGPLGVRGRVTDVGGEPVGEVQLRFVRLDGSEDPRVVRSLPDGSFELGGAGSGVWRLEVTGVGYLGQRMALDLHDEISLSVIVVRQPANYDPTPLELMPIEQPIPPPGFLDDEIADDSKKETETAATEGNESPG
jgi:hypothetical protein